MQEKWDQRYRSRLEPGQACHILREYSHLLPRQGRSLDLACGLGANALFLAQHKLESHGWDISSVALNKLQTFAMRLNVPVSTLQRDVELEPPSANSFDVIVVSQFLYRPLCSALIDALKPSGLLYYQTFNNCRRSSNGPGNPDYLLGTNELLALFAPLIVRAYREDGRSGKPDQGLRDMSYLVAQKPSR